MNSGAGFVSPEGERGEDGQEGHGAARTPRGRRATEKPDWRLAPSGETAGLDPFRSRFSRPTANSPFDKSGALG